MFTIRSGASSKALRWRRRSRPSAHRRSRVSSSSSSSSSSRSSCTNHSSKGSSSVLEAIRLSPF
ncbi:MAG: hypothetical protein EB165_05615 [Euryarchaeota archaeon]|nr:hypothetical protein [Euryarchaeota archaeon]NDB94105.1 hypothetical protein [Euryarchaeota archaeon]